MDLAVVYEEILNGAIAAAGGDPVTVVISVDRFESFLAHHAARMQDEPERDTPWVAIGKPLGDGRICWVTVKPEDHVARKDRQLKREEAAQVAKASEARQRLMQAGSI